MEYKKVWLGIIIWAVLVFLFFNAAFAAGVTLSLSEKSGCEGDSIEISGSGTPDEWIMIKSLDADGNIIFIKPVKAETDGTYSVTVIIPEVEAGILQIIAGSGSDVKSVDFTVEERPDEEEESSSEAAESSSETVHEPALLEETKEPGIMPKLFVTKLPDDTTESTAQASAKQAVKEPESNEEPEKIADEPEDEPMKEPEASPILPDEDKEPAGDVGSIMLLLLCGAVLAAGTAVWFLRRMKKRKAESL